jgi:hypothetical protein
MLNVFFFSKWAFSGATHACARWPELGELMPIHMPNVHEGFSGPEIAHLQVGNLWHSGVVR